MNTSQHNTTHCSHICIYAQHSSRGDSQRCDNTNTTQQRKDSHRCHKTQHSTKIAHHKTNTEEHSSLHLTTPQVALIFSWYISKLRSHNTTRLRKDSHRCHNMTQHKYPAPNSTMSRAKAIDTCTQ